MVFRKTLKICAGSIVCLFLSVWAAVPGYSRDVPLIRVVLAKGAGPTVVAVAGPYELIDAANGALLKKGRGLSSSKVVATAGGILIGREEWPKDEVLIKVRRRAGLRVNGRPYRGALLIVKDDKEGLLFVNAVDVESYIKGVLVHEVSPKWPMAALKAQAVAARTYALYQKQVMGSRPYDVTADVSSQVYGGSRAETGRTNRAVNFTAGDVLTYKGKIFPAYFHATCGGVTENASELWKISAEPLAGGRLCSFCSESPHFFWKRPCDLAVVQKKLGSRYTLKGDLASLAIEERNPTGRVRRLLLRDVSGRTMEISAKDFRHVIGSDTVRSTNFSITLEKGRVVLSGKGWGHGVGLCQWGALGMSRSGYDYSEILEFYYPGAALRGYDAL